MLLIIASAVPASCASMDISGTSGRMGNDGFSIVLPSMRLSLEAGPLSVGEIDRRGLVRTLSELHDGRWDLSLEASRFRSDGWRSGAVLSLGPLSLGMSLNDRAFAAASLSFNHVDAAVLYAFAGSSPDSFMEDRHESERQDVLYGGLSFSWWIFRAAGIFSFSPVLGLDGYLSLAAEHGRYSITLAAGSRPVLYSDDARYLYSISGTIGEDGFLSQFSFKIGNEPVFSDEYLGYEAYIKSGLELYGITIYSSMEYCFSSHGHSTKSDRFTIEAYGFELGYDNAYGIVAVYDAGIVEFGYDEGRFFAAIEHEMAGSMSRMHLRLSSDRLIDVAISIDL